MGPFASDELADIRGATPQPDGFTWGDLYDTTDAAGRQEFPLQAFAKIVSLIVALNQFTYAFDPRVLGAIRDVTGS